MSTVTVRPARATDLAFVEQHVAAAGHRWLYSSSQAEAGPREAGRHRG
jgi:hypothetical protein